MISGRIQKRTSRVLGYVLVALYLSSCQAETGSDQYINGNWRPIEFSQDTVSVGPDGGHFIVTIHYPWGVGLEYISDVVTRTSKHWTVSDGNKLQMDEISVYSPKDSKIEIDVAPSDDLNEWRVGIQCMNAHGAFTVIQNNF